MKNVTRKIMYLLFAVCLMVTGIAYNPTSVQAASYKKSISKKLTVSPDKGRTLTVDVKNKASVKITVKATDGKSDNFFLYHGSDCACGGMDMGPSMGKKTITRDTELSKGKHTIIIWYEDDGGKL